MVELIQVSSGSVNNKIVSMPASFLLMSAMVSSYSKSFTVRIPLTINLAYTFWAKSMVRQLYVITLIRGSAL